MAYVSTSEQVAQFQRIVLHHMLQLEGEEWGKWRSYSRKNPCPYEITETGEVVARTEEHYQKTRAEVAEQVGESCMYLSELLEGKLHEKIGELDSEPVYYLPQLGMYVWGDAAHGRHTLDIWLSYPAFPPGFC